MHQQTGLDSTNAQPGRPSSRSRRAMALRIMGCAGLFCFLAASATQCPSTMERCNTLASVDVGGYSLYYQDEGSGGPAIIFMAGEDDNLTVWRKVQPAVAGYTRAIAYDRGGVGCSEQGSNPRTAQVVSDELNAFLNALGINEPVILCAHSFGGLFARYFTNQHPDRVAGLVLVDTTHERLENLMAEQLKPETLEKEDLEYGIYFGVSGKAGVWGEYYNRYNSYDEVIENRTLPDIPLVYLSAGNYNPGEVPADQATIANGIKEQLDEDQASLSPQGQLIVDANSGHDIQIKDPQAVIDVIQQVYDAVTTP